MPETKLCKNVAKTEQQPSHVLWIRSSVKCLCQSHKMCTSPCNPTDRPTDRNRQKKDQAATHSTASWRILAKRSPRNITHFRILRPGHGGYRICQPHLQSLHRFCFTVGWANRRSIHFASAKSDSSLRARSRFEVNFEAVERDFLTPSEVPRVNSTAVRTYKHATGSSTIKHTLAPCFGLAILLCLHIMPIGDDRQDRLRTCRLCKANFLLPNLQQN